MKILLLTDGSAHSAAAARWLADNARKLTAPLDIHLLHVHLPLPYPAAAAVVGRGAVERYFHEASEEALAGVAEILQRAQLSFEKTWIVGEVTPAIAAHVRDGAFDLVVMGSHGRGALLNLAMGSVATKCLALLQIPVLVVPAARAAPQLHAPPLASA